MSKETFSEKISESMYKKISAIESGNSNIFLEKDENFEVALCLSYMTLSKEKIIAKDMKNTDRMARLSQMVDTSEIDKVFKPGFSKEMPKILYAKENNNLWILDNIRDSIMHGVFDIDEDKKCFLINNTQHDRELIAEIPFSWFIAYAKNDILSKKISNNYTIRSFYYNNNKKDKKHFDTKRELMNNILYRVNITGNKFNVKDIENRIKELFDKYSKEDINDDLIKKYRNRIDSEKIKYNEKYLVSFYIASEKVKDCIEKEFPGTDVKIYIDNRKFRFVNKTSKKLPKYYFNYDLMFDTFNNKVSRKGMSLLNYLTNIIENIDTNKTSNSYFDNINNFNILLNGEKIKYTKNNDIYLLTKQNLEMLRTICLNVYGLSTLVINHENLYNNHFLCMDPALYGFKARLKSLYLEYAQKSKNIIMKILETEISLFSKQDQFAKCNDSKAKLVIQSSVNSLQTKKQFYENELYNLPISTHYQPAVISKNIDYKNKEKLEMVLSKYFNHFYSAKSVTAKRKIKKIISKLIDEHIEEESKYTFGCCNDMKEVLTIIRNSFSHIGRVYIGKDRQEQTTIILNDYDTNGEKSGEVICKYINLIELLRDPYVKSKQNKTL